MTNKKGILFDSQSYPDNKWFYDLILGDIPTIRLDNVDRVTNMTELVADSYHKNFVYEKLGQIRPHLLVDPFSSDRENKITAKSIFN